MYFFVHLIFYEISLKLNIKLFLSGEKTEVVLCFLKKK